MNFSAPCQLNLPPQLLDKRGTTLYLTAPHSGDGTSSCILSIAKQLSSSYCKKVVIIDGNPGRSSISQQFKLHDQPGIQDYNTSSKTHFQQLAQTVDGESFFIVPAGKMPSDRQETNHSKIMELCLEQLCLDFDLILFDAPAIYSQTNRLNLAAKFHGTILIVDANTTRKEVATSARERLADMQLQVVGTILNQRQYHVPKWLYNML